MRKTSVILSLVLCAAILFGKQIFLFLVKEAIYLYAWKEEIEVVQQGVDFSDGSFLFQELLIKKPGENEKSLSFTHLTVTPSWNKKWKFHLAAEQADLVADLRAPIEMIGDKDSLIESLCIDQGRAKIQTADEMLSFSFSLDKKGGLLQTEQGGKISFSIGGAKESFLLQGDVCHCFWEELFPVARLFFPSLPKGKGLLFAHFSVDSSSEKHLQFSAQAKDISLFHPWGDLYFGWGSFSFSSSLDRTKKITDGEIYADFSKGRWGKIDQLSGFFSSRPDNGIQAKIEQKKEGFLCELKAFEKKDFYEWAELSLSFPAKGKKVDLFLEEQRKLYWKGELEETELSFLTGLFSPFLEEMGISDLRAKKMAIEGSYSIPSTDWESIFTLSEGYLFSDKIGCHAISSEQIKMAGRAKLLHSAKGVLQADKLFFQKVNVSDLRTSFDCTREAIEGEIEGTIADSSFKGSLGGNLETIIASIDLSGKISSLQKYLFTENRKSWEKNFISSQTISCTPLEKKFSIQGELQEGKGKLFFSYENQFMQEIAAGKITCDFEEIDVTYIDPFLPWQCERGSLSGRLCLTKGNWTIHAEAENPLLQFHDLTLDGVKEKNWFITALYEGEKQHWYADLYVPFSRFSRTDKKTKFSADGVTLTWEKDNCFFSAENVKEEGLSFALQGNVHPEQERISLEFSSLEGVLDPLAEFASWQSSYPSSLVTKGDGKLLLEQGGIKDLSFFGEVIDGEVKFPYGSLHKIRGEIELDLGSEKLQLLNGSGEWQIDGESYILSMPIFDFFENRGKGELSLSQSFYDICRFQVEIEKEKEKWIGRTIPESSYLFHDHLEKGEIVFVKGEVDSFVFQGAFDSALLLKSIEPFIPYSLQKESVEGKIFFELEKDSFLFSSNHCKIGSYHFPHLQLEAQRKKDSWTLQGSDGNDHYMELSVEKGEKGWKIGRGRVGEKNGWEGLFTGIKKEKVLYGEILSLSFPWRRECIADIHAKGVYSLSFLDKTYTLDLDIDPIEVQRGELIVKNGTSLHLHVDKESGCELSGIACSAQHPDYDFSNFYLSAQNLIFSLDSTHLQSGKMEVIVPTSLIGYLSEKEKALSPEVKHFLAQWATFPYLELEGNMALSPSLFSFQIDSSTLPSFPHFQVKELQGKQRESHWELEGVLSYKEQDFFFRNDFSHREIIQGSLFLSDEKKALDPLHVEWTYSEGRWEVERVTGSLLGITADLVEASKEKGIFLGSVWIDFSSSHLILPEDVSLAADFLQLGKGFELKGRWDLNQDLLFKGLFTGKNCSIMGYTFKTLLSQVNFSTKEASWFDLKLSDSCGIIKSDYIHLSEKKDKWTLSIPIITMHEFRPSLLQKEGEKKGVLDPFLIRELQLHKLQGTIGEEESFTGSGNFHFINSFKRGQTLLDIPSEFLGRIFGLDLELLIPVRGEVQYEIKEGKVAFTELNDAFSENQRSEFFFVKEHPPTMDLQGNLSIHIGMKHYVLFTFTENFIISVKGRLLDPSFRLKRKKAFSL